MRRKQSAESATKALADLTLFALGQLKMPGCAAVGCHNRSEKGYIMKCFPRDPKLRKLWQERVARADWEPSNNSFLCHVHFDPEEWSITQSGRIRLKKNAVPSIFHVTSTRKSLKKRTKLGKNVYATDYLVNDTEYSSIGQEKDSDSQDASIDDPCVELFDHRFSSRSPKMTENNQNSPGRCRNAVLLISDDNNTETDVRNEKSETSISTSLTETSHRNAAAGVKAGVKRDLDRNSIYESYDEIEEKLKQICDGYREENASNDATKANAIPAKQRRILERSQVPLHRSISYKYSSRNEIGEMLADDTGNIEIIFGSESGEECAHVPKCTSRGNEHGETEKPNRDPNLDRARIGSNSENREPEKPSTVWTIEGTEEAYGEENITPIRAAMKRKRRTRDEIMQSIKKSIRSTVSSQGTTSLNHSDTSDNVAGTENEAVRSQGTKNASEAARSKDVAGSSVTTKFTVKVTGDADDVVDIMQDLFKDTNDFIIEKHGDADSQQDHASARSVTSIITIEDCHPMDGHVEERDGDTLSRIASPRSHAGTPSYRPRQISQRFDEPLNELEVNNDCTTPSLAHAATYEHRKLQEKVKLQENVIKKLTDQLLLYKDLEKNLQNKNLMLKAKTREIENLMGEFNGRSADGTSASSASYKKTVDPRRGLIDDLSSSTRTYFEELNKKLMKTVNVEYQQKRKLESLIKQRDNQIKELNWKLEKASKFLERAEKNTNTYRRKMLNMQTFMRRKKLLEEQMSMFNEMLMDSAKEGYSEKTLTMAKELKEICSTNGYSKLLNFGFPLPTLSALQEASCETHLQEFEQQVARAALSEERDAECPATKTRSEVRTESTREVEIALDNTETITGTVQDIFDESNDEDDFSTNELREHFILQLNAVM